MIVNIEIASGLKQTVHCPDYFTKEDNNCYVLITYCLWTATIVYLHLRKSKLSTKRNNEKLILSGNALYLQSINLMLCSVKWNNINYCYHKICWHMSCNELQIKFTLQDGLKNMIFFPNKTKITELWTKFIDTKFLIKTCSNIPEITEFR